MKEDSKIIDNFKNKIKILKNIINLIMQKIIQQFLTQNMISLKELLALEKNIQT